MHRVLEIRICTKFDIFGRVVKTLSEIISSLVQRSNFQRPISGCPSTRVQIRYLKRPFAAYSENQIFKRKSSFLNSVEKV